MISGIQFAACADLLMIILSRNLFELIFNSVTIGTVRPKVYLQVGTDGTVYVFRIYCIVELIIE